MCLLPSEKVCALPSCNGRRFYLMYVLNIHVSKGAKFASNDAMFALHEVNQGRVGKKIDADFGFLKSGFMDFRIFSRIYGFFTRIFGF